MTENQRAAFLAAKAKADAEFAKRQQAKETQRRMVRMKIDVQKQMAAIDHTVRTMGTGEKPILQVNNRPAEKLAKGKTRGMKRTGGISM